MQLDIYDKIMMLSKRRGIIYPSFEIYGGSAGFYDYGPLGSRIKQNIENLWRSFYLLKDNCVEISTPTITLFEVLKASGHVDEFTDLTVNCKKCNQSYKVEELLKDKNIDENSLKNNEIKCQNCGNFLKDPFPVNLMFSTEIGVFQSRDAFLRPETAQGIFTDFHLLYRYFREKLPFGVIQIGRGYRNEVSPRQGIIRLREFSMAEAEIFIDPKDKAHPKFSKYQDKTLYLFNNEKKIKISLNMAVKNGIINNQALAYYMYLTQEFLISSGIDLKKFRFRKHSSDELAHYAKECWDAELYSERFGWIECVGVADRSAYDLESHINSSKTDMYAKRVYNEPEIVKVKKIVPKKDVIGPLFKAKSEKIISILKKIDIEDSENISVKIDNEIIDIPKNCYDFVEINEKKIGEKFIPHVIEPSYGIDRIIYCILEHSYHEIKKKGEEYRILKLNNIIAPIKIGVFPLVNDNRLIKIAKELDEKFRESGISTYYDQGGTIGRRYARMDEVGTPFCLTVDHKTLENNSVTIRNRDTTKQIRKNIDDVCVYIKDILSK